VINVGKNFICIASILKSDIVANPLDYVVLESALDNLIQEVRSQKFVNVSTGEMDYEWLESYSQISEANIYKKKIRTRTVLTTLNLSQASFSESTC
jgi:hypothetical protein